MISRELGIGIVPYSPVGRGFFAGKGVTEILPESSFLVKELTETLAFHNYEFALNISKSCFLSAFTSKVYWRKSGEEQDSLFKVEDVVFQAPLHTCSISSRLGSSSRR